MTATTAPAGAHPGQKHFDAEVSQPFLNFFLAVRLASYSVPSKSRYDLDFRFTHKI
jgi:hypothetical protein